ncbi:WYL domain-containing protein [Spirochaetales bacterium NM-380-WT-3C1]|uniref:WYL domain-containing protein n=1 Tax=Bullifex porci TaxID=2606638 RepID=A0A7X2TQH9_9SPIO|nr:WYL domain-containing protein [Bullifex porci]
MPNFNKLVFLATKLASDNGVTIQELLRDESLGYNSRSSIYQDFRNLEISFGLTPYNTEENRGKSGREAVYRIDKDEWNKFKSGFLTKTFSGKERRRLAFMLESIGSLSPLVNVSTDDIIPKLNSIIGDISIDTAKFGGYFNLETTKFLDILLEAQETKELLYITYGGDRRDLFVIKCFVFSGGTYCYVMDIKGKSYMLSVQRIEYVERKLLKNNIPYPTPDVDIDKALSDPFGIVRENEEFDAVVKLSDGQGYYEKEKLWPDSVNIEKEDDHWLFKVHTCGEYWLIRWVLSLGTEAELLEPQWLRDKIKEEINSLAVIYQ